MKLVCCHRLRMNGSLLALVGAGLPVNPWKEDSGLQQPDGEGGRETSRSGARITLVENARQVCGGTCPPIFAHTALSLLRWVFRAFIGYHKILQLHNPCSASGEKLSTSEEVALGVIITN